MKIKKKIIVLFLFCVIGFIAYKILDKLQYKKQIAKRIETVPFFSFKATDGSRFTQKELTNNPLIFIYFNSDCDYCESETIKIKERLNEFKNFQLIFISIEDRLSIMRFAKKHQLNNQANIVFLEDVKGEFSEIFNANSTPYTLVYDGNKKLLKKFRGATKVDDILRAIYKMSTF